LKRIETVNEVQVLAWFSFRTTTATIEEWSPVLLGGFSLLTSNCKVGDNVGERPEDPHDPRIACSVQDHIENNDRLGSLDPFF
jgi:hypothetical protein